MTDPASLPSFPPPPEEHPLRGRVLDALIDEGLAPNVDAEGDVAVEVSGQKVFVRCADQPVPMMRVFGQWRIGQGVPEDELSRLRAANDVTARLNLVKASVHKDVLLVAVDLVVLGTPPLRQLLSGALQGVLAAVKTWHVAAGGADPGQAGAPGGGGPAGGGPEGSGPEGSGPEGSGPEGSGPGG